MPPEERSAEFPLRWIWRRPLRFRRAAIARPAGPAGRKARLGRAAQRWRRSAAPGRRDHGEDGAARGARAGYSARCPALDEFLGRRRDAASAPWEPLLSEWCALTPSELSQRFGLADRHVLNTGVSYRDPWRYRRARSGCRRASLASRMRRLVIPESEWEADRGRHHPARPGPVAAARRHLRAGRADRERPSFRPPWSPAAPVICALAGPPGGGSLQLYAADLGPAAPTGAGGVLQRPDAGPAGAGYALENRLAGARLAGHVHAA